MRRRKNKRLRSDIGGGSKRKMRTELPCVKKNRHGCNVIATSNGAHHKYRRDTLLTLKKHRYFWQP